MRPHWRRNVATLLLVLAGAALAAPPAEGIFPVFRGKDLLGRAVSTESFRGKAWLVVIGFERAHAPAMEAWARALRAAQPDTRLADYFEIAALPGALAPLRGTIDGRMARGTPEQARGNIMTVYAADSLCRHLRLRDRKQVHVFVLDADGRITHRAAGEPAGAPLEEVLRAVAAAAPRVAPSPAPAPPPASPPAR